MADILARIADYKREDVAARKAARPIVDVSAASAPRGFRKALEARSGDRLALIAEVTEPSRVGGVTGLVGAAGGLGGFVPPLVMGFVYGRTESYAIGLWLLSVVAALTLALTLTIVRRTAQRQETH